MTFLNTLVRTIIGFVVLSSFTMCVKPAVDAEVPGTTAAKDSTSQSHVNAVAAYTYTVQPSQWYVDGTNIPAGAIIYIPAGTRGALLFKNLKGTEADPIIIVNKGGKAILSTSTTASYGFKTQNCSYFEVRGNGDPNITYGITVSGGNIGMTMDDLSSDFEVSNVEVVGAGFAGIMAKTDPTCDVATQRGNFTMKNVSLHDNYVHKTGGEGFYVGNSFYAEGVSVSCGKVLPHDVNNLQIYNNRIDSTGCEGIQVGSAVADCAVYKNRVSYPGLAPFASGQNNGIQIGEGTGGKCYGNLVRNAPGNGIIVLGLGDNQVFNNIILNSGSYGIFADSRYTPGPYFQFVNNTIVNSQLGGIKMNSVTIPMNVVINNVIIGASGSNAIIRMNSSVKLTSSNNYINTKVAACKFVNYNQGDFHLQVSSPLINAGLNTANYGVVTDFYDKTRPAGSAFDIGATEY
ncbi:right-handed parallel beta-helix repeat-containing protein [Mucilaginibacter litoreus]|uniref:Right-handed parallel beta-helix repeat-containing protein n=1 Tax=Mucilaginibacter litoreus TaxID=1048221 RepID=A0ABW3AXR8_9SPHI